MQKIQRKKDVTLSQGNLDQKVVWITGASSGIGEALAQVFANLGAKVVLSARRSEELERVRQQLNHPENHLCVAFDVTQADQAQYAVEQVIEKFQRIDYLINNAGLSQRALIADTTIDTERRIMEIDYFAQISLTKSVLPYFENQGSGHVIFISSVAGLLGTQYRASYSAAKGAIHMWANSLRAEYAEKGLNVSVVFPGFVKTNVSFNALNGAGQAQAHQDEAIENGLEADDFAQKVVKAVLSNKEYIVIGGLKEKLGVAISRVSPKLMYKMIRKSKVK